MVPELENPAVDFTDAIGELHPRIPGQAVGPVGRQVNVEDVAPRQSLTSDGGCASSQLHAELGAGSKSRLAHTRTYSVGACWVALELRPWLGLRGTVVIARTCREINSFERQIAFANQQFPAQSDV
jgi:hypothetical protein